MSYLYFIFLTDFHPSLFISICSIIFILGAKDITNHGWIYGEHGGHTSQSSQNDFKCFILNDSF